MMENTGSEFATRWYFQSLTKRLIKMASYWRFVENPRHRTDAGGDPREPSPEEIAFGSNGETDSETDSTDTEGVSTAGSSSAEDPLADPTDDE